MSARTRPATLPRAVEVAVHIGAALGSIEYGVVVDVLDALARWEHVPEVYVPPHAERWTVVVDGYESHYDNQRDRDHAYWGHVADDQPFPDRRVEFLSAAEAEQGVTELEQRLLARVDARVATLARDHIAAFHR